MGFSTDAIHAGQEFDLTTNAVVTPIYMTSTYANFGLGNNKGYHYGRTNNVTRESMEKNIAVLEKGEYGIAFSSGVAAVQSIMGLVKSGDHIIATNSIYGGTYRLFEMFFKNFGISFSWVDMLNPKNVEDEIRDNTKLVFMETPSNPMLTLTDLLAVSDICKKYNLISVVDNTFMSPYFQKPLLLGADIVLHSTTKYLNGHSDVVGGVVVTNNKELNDKIRFVQKAIGAVPSPFDCFLTLRSTKTLAVRMDKHNQNALIIAEFLEKHPKVKSVNYPGLKTQPQYNLAKKQMSGFGGMISFDTGDFDITKKFFERTKLFILAESLGGVESLSNHPVTMSHASMPEDERMKLGITDSLIRLSVGIEDIDDLLNDIENSLK
ncbi:MAG TPA: PLP-dependent aspartate aminotransferase family protein [Melioribacteraceae bacterium]|nr:PLP-dependent aspartate aminotransferase family protein [Melioribacteraceae bacterium]